MDLNLMELIQSLHREMEMLDRAIASLEKFRQISRSRRHSSGKAQGTKIDEHEGASTVPL